MTARDRKGTQQPTVKAERDKKNIQTNEFGWRGEEGNDSKDTTINRGGGDVFHDVLCTYIH